MEQTGILLIPTAAIWKMDKLLSSFMHCHGQTFSLLYLGPPPLRLHAQESPQAEFFCIWSRTEHLFIYFWCGVCSKGNMLHGLMLTLHCYSENIYFYSNRGKIQETQIEHYLHVSFSHTVCNIHFHHKAAMGQFHCKCNLIIQNLWKSERSEKLAVKWAKPNDCCAFYDFSFFSISIALLAWMAIKEYCLLLLILL